MTTVFVPNPVGIASLTAPGGHVWRFVRRIGVETNLRAKLGAPARSGELKAKIHGPDMSSTPSSATATVTAGARHSLWVHEGTRTPITRPGGGLMPIHSGGAIVAYKRAVRGQRAQPFLAEGLREAFLAAMRRR